MSNNFHSLVDLIDEISMGPFGSDIKVENFVDSGVPVLNGSNLSAFKLVEEDFKYVSIEKAKTFKKAIAKRGDIVVTHRGTLGQISYIPNNSKYEEYVISQSQFKVTLKKDLVDPIFLTYYFHTNEGQKRLLANKCHVGVPALAQATTNFKKIQIPLPPIDLQKKIVDVLLAIDEKIEINNKLNNVVENLIEIIYTHWFIQLDFPNNGAPYKTSAQKMEWNEVLKKDIPFGWTAGTLSDLGTIVGGSTPSKNIADNFDKTGFPWITPKDLSLNGGNKFISSGEIGLTDKGLKSATLKRLPKGSVLLSSRAPIGYLAIASVEMTTNQGFKSFIPDKGFHSEYLYYAIKNTIPAIVRNASGSTFKEISTSVLKDIKVILPPKDVAEKFKSAVLQHFALQETLEKENELLGQLRNWLLPMLMNGQINLQ